MGTCGQQGPGVGRALEQGPHSALGSCSGPGPLAVWAPGCGRGGPRVEVGGSSSRVHVLGKQEPCSGCSWKWRAPLFHWRVSLQEAGRQIIDLPPTSPSPLRICKTDRPTNRPEIASLLCLTQISVWKLRQRMLNFYNIFSHRTTEGNIRRKHTQNPEVLLTLCVSWLSAELGFPNMVLFL